VDRYRVLRFDMRGHGASTWAERASALTLDELTDDLFAVMDAAGVVQAHLVGESIGGTLRSMPPCVSRSGFTRSR
jgi:pimeloyl-ACP methyl ester carboxylesterase